MKSLLKSFLFFLLFFTFSLCLKAKSNYSDAVDDARDFMTTSSYADTYSKFIQTINDTNKFYSINDNIVDNEDFKYGGLLGKWEFDITRKGKSNNYSYLYNSNDYWTYTNEHNKKYVVSSSSKFVDYKDNNNVFDTRVTEFPYSHVSVTGSGAYLDPWIFEPQYSVTIKVNDSSRGKLGFSKDDINKDIISFTMSSSSDKSIYIKPLSGNEYLGTTCGVIANDFNIRNNTNGSHNTMIIHKVTRDVECTINFGEKSNKIILHKYPNSIPASHEELYVIPNKGWYEDQESITSISKLSLSPVLAGYEYNGYYSKDNGSTGKFKQNCEGIEVISKENVLGSPSLKEDGITIYTDNKVIYPCFIPNKYIVEYKCGEVDGVVLSEEHIYNVEKKLSSGDICSKTGYDFVGWNTSPDKSGTHYNENSLQKEMTTNSKLTLYAEWDAKTYIVKFKSNGRGTPSITEKKVTYDGTYEMLPTISSPGYTFDGWYTSATGGIKITSSTKVTITGDQILYAHWTPNSNTKYVVNHYKMIGENASVASTPFRTDTFYGTTDTNFIPDDKKVTLEGYSYREAKNESGTTITKASIAPDGSTIVNLYYNQNYITITYKTNGATTIKYKGKELTNDVFSNQTKQILYYDNQVKSGLSDYTNKNYIYLTKTGYKATKNWYNGSIKQNTLDPVTGKFIAEKFDKDISVSNATLTLYAEWEIIDYSITYVLNGGNQEANAPLKYNYNSSDIILPKNPTRDGYTFDGWKTKEDLSGNSVTKIPAGSTGNQTYYAKWIKPTLPLFTYTGKFQLVKDNDKIIVEGEDKKISIPVAYENYTDNWKIRFLTDGELTMHKMPGGNKIDVFLVGGGGGINATGHGYQCGGAGGGYTKTVTKTIILEKKYEIDIGAGGKGTLAVNVVAGRGEPSKAFGETADGGYGSGGGGANVGCAKGGDGGSGGGGACDNIYPSDKQELAAGGTDGADGIGCRPNSKGKGQGSTTREFGETNGKLYAAGGGGSPGGGAWGERNKNKGGGEENTGGGAYARLNARKIQDNPEIYEWLPESSLDGFSGIVIIRNAR